MNQHSQRDSLYQEPPATGGDPPRAPGLLDQVLGVFTGPVPLFRRLAVTPRWGWALAVIMGFTLAMVLIWSARVDADALLRPVLARDPKVAADQIGRIIEIQGRLLGLFGAVGILVGGPVISLLLASLYWLVGRAAPGPGGAPGYRQALSAAVVPGLVGLPKVVLIGVLCLVRPVRGLTPDALSPLGLGAWLGTGQVRLDAFLTAFDLVAAANLVLAFLAARHLLGLRTAAALACVLAAAALTVGWPVLSAR